MCADGVTRSAVIRAALQDHLGGGESSSGGVPMMRREVLLVAEMIDAAEGAMATVAVAASTAVGGEDLPAPGVVGAGVDDAQVLAVR